MHASEDPETFGDVVSHADAGDDFVDVVTVDDEVGPRAPGIRRAEVAPLEVDRLEA